MKMFMLLSVTFVVFAYASACQLNIYFGLLDCSREGLENFKPKDGTNYGQVRFLDLRSNNLTNGDIPGIKMKSSRYNYTPQVKEQDLNSHFGNHFITLFTLPKF